MTTFRTFASGSSGNASLLVSGGTRLLLDMGVSCRRVCQALACEGLRPGDLSAILITHEHTDHIKGLATYVKKYQTPIICTPGTARQLSRHTAGIAPLLRPAAIGEPLPWADTEITPLPTSHDCSESAAYHISTPDGAVGCLTDTGCIPDMTAKRMLGVELLALESNHDVDMLLAGPYPYPLKRRILGPEGHLSNADAARFAAASARAGTHTILLMHLSRENNLPLLALETVRQALDASGWSGTLDAAPPDAMSKRYCLEGTSCSG